MVCGSWGEAVKAGQAGEAGGGRQRLEGDAVVGFSLVFIGFSKVSGPRGAPREKKKKLK